MSIKTYKVHLRFEDARPDIFHHNKVFRIYKVFRTSDNLRDGIALRRGKPYEFDIRDDPYAMSWVLHIDGLFLETQKPIYTNSDTLHGCLNKTFPIPLSLSVSGYSQFVVTGIEPVDANR